MSMASISAAMRSSKRRRLEAGKHILTGSAIPSGLMTNTHRISVRKPGRSSQRGPVLGYRCRSLRRRGDRSTSRHLGQGHRKPASSGKTMCPQLSQIMRPLVRIFIALKPARATQYGQQFCDPLVVKIEIPAHAQCLNYISCALPLTVRCRTRRGAPRRSVRRRGSVTCDPRDCDSAGPASQVCGNPLITSRREMS